MAKIKNTCGCVADERTWLNICEEHRPFHEACVEATVLSSIEALLRYYERNPSDDNLQYLIKRVKEHGNIVAKSKPVSHWLISNRGRLTGNRS